MYDSNSPAFAGAVPDEEPDKTPVNDAAVYEWPEIPFTNNPFDPASYLQQAAAEFSAIQSAVHQNAMDYVLKDDPPYLDDNSDNESPIDPEVSLASLASASIRRAYENRLAAASSTVRLALSDVPLNEFPELHYLSTAPSTKDTTKKK